MRRLVVVAARLVATACLSQLGPAGDVVSQFGIVAPAPQDAGMAKHHLAHPGKGR